MLSTHFRRFWMLCGVVGLLTAVFGLVVAQDTPPPDADRPSRMNIEDIPHYPLAETPEAQYQIESLSVVPASKVVFQSYRNGNWNIFTGNDDGTGQTAVTSHEEPEIHPHLNRGNTAIVYASLADDHDYEVYRMIVDGSYKVALTNNQADDGNPQWSPDGSRIVFESYRDGQAEIYVMNADGSNQVRLTNHSAFDGMPSWSPDGSKIAFSSNRTGAYRIWVMNADGSSPVQVSTQPYSFRPQWSPDGTRIAFDADGNNNGWQEMWVVNADGTNPVPLIIGGDTADYWVGSWSPDGRYIAATYIHFVFHQGNWYWDTARLIARSSNEYIYLSPNTLDWNPRWQTNDWQKPVSQVHALPAVSPGPFSVSWSGSDTGGSGLKNYDVQVKTGANGVWTDWQVATTATSAAYTGVPGQTYYFRSRARDSAFNVEVWPANPDSATMIENYPPISSISPLQPYSWAYQAIDVRWGGSDPGGSGIVSYDVQYRVDNGNWTNWQANTSATSEVFTDHVAGHTYEFRVRARDRAQNQGNWSASGANGHTTVYTWSLTGTAYDNSGAPVPEAEVSTTPSAFSVVADDRNGRYEAYVADAAESYTAVWSKDSYGALPSTVFQGSSNGNSIPGGERDVFLPPADNLLQNWGFENGSFGAGDWQPTGVGTAVVTTETQHTGQYAALLGPVSLYEQAQDISINGSFSQNAKMVIDNNDIIHLVYLGLVNNDHYELFYTRRLQNGSWSLPQNLSPNILADVGDQPGIVHMVLDQNGSLHLTWSGYPVGDWSYPRVYYMQRNTSGIWSSPVVVSANLYARWPEMTVDNNGIVHIAWQYHYAYSIYYSRREINGVWSVPIMISLIDDYTTESARIVVENNGTVHVAWREYGGLSGAHLYYTRRNVNGIWTTPQILIDNFATIEDLEMTIDSQQDVHLIWHGKSNYELDSTMYYTRLHNGVWSTPYPIAQTEAFGVDMALGDDNSLHLVWYGLSFSPYFTADIMYIKRHSNGSWSNVQNLSSSLSDSSGTPRLAVSATGLPHAVWGNGDCGDDHAIYHSQPKANGDWLLPQPVSSGNGSTMCAVNPEILVDSLGLVHVTWDDMAYTGLIYYTTQAKAAETGDTAVAQTITVPATMTNPTLSFLYQLSGASAANGTGLHVEVDDGTAVTSLFATSDETSDWQHEWVSLAEWSGETITLTFRLHQVDGVPLLNAHLDEVTVGSSYPDVGVTANDTAVLPGESTTLALTYSNRGGAAASGVTLTYTLPAGMTYLSASVPPASTNPLVWHLPELPAKSDPFEILVTARVNANTPPFTTLSSTAVITTDDAELELLNNQAEGHIYTAVRLYLPAIFR